MYENCITRANYPILAVAEPPYLLNTMYTQPVIRT